MTIRIDKFDSDERIFINSASQGIALQEFTRQRFLDNLNFALNITVDEMVLNLVKGLKEKVLLISDEEWCALTFKLPFHTPYGAETNVDEVPDAEAI